VAEEKLLAGIWR